MWKGRCTHWQYYCKYCKTQEKQYCNAQYQFGVDAVAYRRKRYVGTLQAVSSTHCGHEESARDDFKSL